MVSSYEARIFKINSLKLYDYLLIVNMDERNFGHDNNALKLYHGDR